MAIAELTVVLAALKAAGDAVGLAYSADKALSESDWKMRLVEAREAIATARISVLEANDRVAVLEAEVDRLNGALEIKETVVKYKSAYYPVNANGEAEGDPYCMRCWEDDRKLRHLTVGNGRQGDVDCPSCKRKYPYAGAFPIRREA